MEALSWWDFKSGPPLFSQYHGCAAGLIVKGSNVAACLAELVFRLGMQQDAAAHRSCLSTFLQVFYQPLEKIKITLSGLWQMHISPSPLIKLGPFAIPVGGLKWQTGCDVHLLAPPFAITKKALDFVSFGSIALMLDLGFDKNTRLCSWIEVKKSSHNISDTQMMS